MLSYRRIAAGVGAAALAFMALSKVSRCYRQRTGESTSDCIKNAAGKMQGVIRRRSTVVNLDNDATNDAI